MVPWLLRACFIVFAATGAHAQPTTVTDLGDCSKRAGLCGGTHPLIREIETKAARESQVYQEMLFCRSMPLAMQAECILQRAKRYLVEKTPGEFVFVPPKADPALAEAADEEVQKKKRQSEIARLEAQERERQFAAHAAARERARQDEQARLAARSPTEIEAERRAAALLGERLKQTSIAQVRGMLKDPDSARFGDTRVVFNTDRTKVLAICGTVSGTNSYGARLNGPWLFSTESDHAYVRDADGWKGSGLSLWSQHCS